jgi:hypothetical protein
MNIIYQWPCRESDMAACHHAASSCFLQAFANSTAQACADVYDSWAQHRAAPRGGCSCSRLMPSCTLFAGLKCDAMSRSLWQMHAYQLAALLDACCVPSHAAAEKRVRQLVEQQSHYKQAAATSFTTRRVRHQLAAARSACETLDAQAGTEAESVLMQLYPPATGGHPRPPWSRWSRESLWSRGSFWSRASLESRGSLVSMRTFGRMEAFGGRESLGGVRRSFVSRRKCRGWEIVGSRAGTLAHWTLRCCCGCTAAAVSVPAHLKGSSFDPLGQHQ